MSQRLSGHIMLNCSNRRFCVVLWQQKRSWISYRNTFPLQGSLSNPKSFLKIPYLGLSGAPQWRCLTRVVVASLSVSFCCCFNVCNGNGMEKAQKLVAEFSWESSAAPPLAPQRETWNGDKGATSSAGTRPPLPDREHLESRKVFCAASSPAGAAAAVTSPCLSAA